MTQTHAKQHLIARAIRAARDAGLEIGAVDVRPDGSIRILTPDQIKSSADPYEDWKAKKDAHAA